MGVVTAYIWNSLFERVTGLKSANPLQGRQSQEPFPFTKLSNLFIFARCEWYIQ